MSQANLVCNYVVEINKQPRRHVVGLFNVSIERGQWHRLHRARMQVPPTFTNGWARGHRE